MRCEDDQREYDVSNGSRSVLCHILYATMPCVDAITFMLFYVIYLYCMPCMPVCPILYAITGTVRTNVRTHKLGTEIQSLENWRIGDCNNLKSLDSILSIDYLSPARHGLYHLSPTTAPRKRNSLAVRAQAPFLTNRWLSRRAGPTPSSRTILTTIW